MQDPTSNYPSPNDQIELAKKRNRAAAERTLMAWIRTSLSLISFGFGIDQIVVSINRNLENGINTVRLSRFLGLSFIGLGIFALLMAAFEHRRELQQIRQNHYIYISRRSLGLIVAIALIGIGIAAFIGILVNR